MPKHEDLRVLRLCAASQQSQPRHDLPKEQIHGRRTCATLLVDLDVHPREVMRILRHAQISVTMEIYAQASSKATRAALKRLEDSLHG